MTEHKVERPLILVPGILESCLAIIKDSEFYDIWPLKPWVPNYDTLVNLLVDLGNNIPESMGNKPSVVPIGLLPGFFDNLIGAIINKWGYKLEHNFWAFPYDWRQSNKISGQILAEFIKKKNLDSVDIICHSMGGFVVRAACKQGARERIKRTAYIGTPHLGSPLSYFELNPDIPNVGFADFYEKTAIADDIRSIIYGHPDFDNKLNELYRKWPSAYELMPDDNYLENRPMIYSDGQPIHGVNNTYLENEWGLHHHQDMQHKVKNAMKFKENLGELNGNRDETLVIYCNTLKTLDTIGYSSTGITIGGKSFHFFPPFDNDQHGDTIVVTHSAKGSMSDQPRYRHKSIRNVIHAALPNNYETLQEIQKFLNLQ